MNDVEERRGSFSGGSFSRSTLSTIGKVLRRGVVERSGYGSNQSRHSLNYQINSKCSSIQALQELYSLCQIGDLLLSCADLW